MPTDKNIQDLANENKRLMAEYKALKEDNARLEAELAALKAPDAIAPKPTIALPQHRFDTGDKVRRIGKEYEKGRYDTVVMFTINGYCLEKIYGTEDYAYFDEAALIPYIELPAPKFSIGDRVRITGKQETAPPSSDYGAGTYDTIATIEKEGGYKLRYSGGKVSSLIWFDYELAPYNDTE